MASARQAALTLGVGYLLGRRRKRKLAIMLGTATLAGTSSGPAGQILRRGTKMAVSRLGSAGALGKVSPQLGEITGIIRGDLLDAGKAAASTAVTSRIESLSDQLHDRADTLRNPVAEVAGSSGAQDEGDEDGAGERAARRPSPSASPRGTRRAASATTRTAGAGGRRSGAEEGRRTSTAQGRRGGAAAGSTARPRRAAGEAGKAPQRSRGAGSGSSARTRQRPAREAGGTPPVRRAPRQASQGR